VTESEGTAARVDDWGIQQEWLDAHDNPQRSPDETVTRLRELIGTPPDDLEQRAPVVTRRGRRTGLSGTVTCEDGSARELADLVDADFPFGYHVLRTHAGLERSLIVSPGRCYVPDQQRWGWTVQLYAARSAASWGIGDLGDLKTLREWTERLGGGFLLVNPLHAVAPNLPQEASPYLPATRRFRNPVYLRVDGAGEDDLRAGHALGTSELVDRDAAWRLKRRVLRAQYDDDGGSDEDFLRWRADRGHQLQDFATWCALADEHGPDFAAWPAELQQPSSDAVRSFAEDHAEDVSFHAWLQWLLDRQLRDATGDLTVIQDLPIGVSGGGADAWAWQETLARGATVGAPPDMLNTTGQDWGSPPLVPWRLRAAGYAPFIESVRATIAGAGGLRIDHVMGLFRLWWVPPGEQATEGAYVRYPSDDLLDIVALESHRARAVVVGEDLGTVEPAVGEALAERGILSYKVLWFEDDEPAEWGTQALAAVTTHDLPTVAGLWTGSDAEDQLESTTMPETDVRSGRDELLSRLRRDGLGEEASVEEAVRSAYELLAEAPSLLLSLALEDAVLEERRPNVPGTVERENWRIPLRLPLEELVESPEVASLARVVAEAVARRAARAGDATRG
jgi:4-alpha-glucanotransferase